MELSQEFLIDMAINAGGYLIAGVVSVLIYSLFQKKNKKTTIDETIDEVTFRQPLQDVPSSVISEDVIDDITSKRKVEFITFGSSKQRQVPGPETINRLAAQEPSSGRMSRKEAINLAKKMLDAGATKEKIKKVLPVSDSELALLTLNNK